MTYSTNCTDRGAVHSAKILEGAQLTLQCSYTSTVDAYQIEIRSANLDVLYRHVIGDSDEDATFHVTWMDRVQAEHTATFRSGTYTFTIARYNPAIDLESYTCKLHHATGNSDGRAQPGKSVDVFVASGVVIPRTSTCERVT